MQINPNYPMAIKCTTLNQYATYAGNFGRQVFEFSGDSNSTSFQTNVSSLISMISALKAEITAIENAIPPINN